MTFTLDKNLEDKLNMLYGEYRWAIVMKQGDKVTGISIYDTPIERARYLNKALKDAGSHELFLFVTVRTEVAVWGSLPHGYVGVPSDSLPLLDLMIYQKDNT